MALCSCPLPDQLRPLRRGEGLATPPTPLILMEDSAAGSRLQARKKGFLRYFGLADAALPCHLETQYPLP